VRDLTVEASNWRSSEGFEAFLVRHGIPAITGIDTRRLTRHLRTAGAMPCAFGTGGSTRCAPPQGSPRRPMGATSWPG